MRRAKVDSGFERALALDPQTRRICEASAKDAADRAREIMRQHRVTGAAEAAIEVDGTRLQTTDPAGHIIENGSVKAAPIAPLRTAAEQVGARVVDDGGSRA